MPDITAGPLALGDARAARRVASALYLRNPRVTLIDVGRRITDGVATDELAVRVHLRRKPVGQSYETLARLRPDLVVDKSLIPFGSDLVEADYALEPGWAPAASPGRAGRFDPLHGGISISNVWTWGWGTLGGFVRDRASGAPLILSNYHVLAGSPGAGPGLAIAQPGLGDWGDPSDPVATLVRDTIDVGIDAAVAGLTGRRGWAPDEYGLGPVTGLGTPAVGQQLLKSGRGSGLTTGVVDGIEGETVLRYPDGMVRRIGHVCRILPSVTGAIASRPGDSGSLWLGPGGAATGLHFAGGANPETALAIAMPEVLGALGVDLLVAGAPVPDAGAVGAPA